MRETGAGAARSAGREGRIGKRVQSNSRSIKGVVRAGRIGVRTVAVSCKNQMRELVRMEVRPVKAAWCEKQLTRSKG